MFVNELMPLLPPALVVGREGKPDRIGPDRRRQIRQSYVSGSREALTYIFFRLI